MLVPKISDEHKAIYDKFEAENRAEKEAVYACRCKALDDQTQESMDLANAQILAWNEKVRALGTGKNHLMYAPVKIGDRW